VRFNPCGYICEYGRRPYTTACRFWEDSEDESEIIWYVAHPDAPVLPFASVFNSLDMDKEPWTRTGPGEVYGAPRVYNGREAPPGVDGGHVCGFFYDFEYGGKFDESEPPVIYDDNGIPLCCNPPVIASGGAGCGGSAIVPAALTCETATPLALGVWLEVEITATQFLWFRFDGVIFGNYHVELEVLSGPQVFPWRLFAASCPPASGTPVFPPVVPCWTLFQTWSGIHRIGVQSAFAALPTVFRIRYGNGPCPP